MTLDGIISVLKPPAMTSHDVVDYARKALRIRRIGHTGTLDPLAAGVLLLVVGRATRASRYFLELDKSYRVEAVFGLETDSGDADGRLLARCPTDHLRPDAVRRAAEQLTGEQRQTPPLTSAVKVGGVRLYEHARRGENVDVPVRAVRVHRFELLRWWQGADGHPRAMFDVDCGRGTYVRSLIRDLGRRLGTCAMVGFLLRTRVGPYAGNEACTLECLSDGLQVATAGPPGFRPLAKALSFLPSVTVDAKTAIAVAHGRKPDGVAQLLERDQATRLVDRSGRLLAVARRVGGSGKEHIKYEVVFVRPGELE